MRAAHSWFSNCKIPISIDVESGVNVGADRLVNATAAYQIIGGDTIVVDFGTATTFDVINGQEAT